MIREARPQDIAAMVALGAAMHAESAFNWLPFDHDKAVGLASRSIADESRCAFVAEQDGELVGMLVGMVSPYFFCHALIASDLIWYVAPIARGSRSGIGLLRAFEAWALVRGAAEVCIGISTGVAADRTGALLSRMGYTSVGGTHKRRLDDVA